MTGKTVLTCVGVLTTTLTCRGSTTAGKFNSANILLTVMSQYGELDAAVAQKQQYAGYRAKVIAEVQSADTLYTFLRARASGRLFRVEANRRLPPVLPGQHHLPVVMHHPQQKLQKRKSPRRRRVRSTLSPLSREEPQMRSGTNREGS